MSDSPALYSRWLLLLKIEIYSCHLEWRVELSDTILKWDYPRTIPAKFGLIWLSGFKEDDLNNLYKSSHAVHSRWLLLLKIEISLVVNFCFITNQNELKF
jgi:hypothetical protein